MDSDISELDQEHWLSNADTGMTSCDSAEPEPTKFFTPNNDQFYSLGQYSRLNPDKHEIRILEVLPGNNDGLIQCKLIEPPQSCHLPYECVSYRAGDPGDTSQIQVNGHVFNVFATLGGAIRQLRLPDQSRWLWTDQICINQADVEERGSQVLQMAKTYERAERVHAWLGFLEDGELVRQGLLRLRFAYNEAHSAYTKDLGDQYHLMPVDRESIKEQVALSLKVQYDNQESSDAVVHYSALGQLFQCEFWDRLWIMQEIIVAKAVSLTWNTCSMELAEVLEAVDIISSLHAIIEREGSTIPTNMTPLTARLTTDGSRGHSLRISRFRHARNTWTRKKGLDFKGLLSNSHRMKCSDPRDRIFAFCGLISEKYHILPDYRSSVESVYINSVLSIILAERSLDVLAYCRHPHLTRSTRKLPSWCPDWSLPVTRSNWRSPLLWDDIGSRHCRFQASKRNSGMCYWKPGVIENGEFSHVSLSASGILLGEVQEIGDVPALGGTFEDLVKCWSELVSQMPYLTSSVLERIEKTATVDDRGYPGVTIPRNAIDADNYERLKLDAIEGNRRFIITDFDAIGMAPPHVQVGDAVCVLFGARVPFVLRKDGDFSTLVGEVYLSSGYMTGKAVDMMELGVLHKTMLEIR